MILYKWFYNIFKISFTYYILYYLLSLLIDSSNPVYILFYIVLLPFITAMFCYGQDFVDCEFDTNGNWFDLMIKFIFGYKQQNYKYKIDEITYKDNNKVYFPRVKTGLITPYYYLIKDPYLSNKFNFKLHKQNPFKSQSDALYIITEYKNHLNKKEEKKKRKKDAKTIKEKKTITFTFTSKK